MALQTWVSSTFNTTNTYIKSRTVVELNSQNISANTSNVRIYVQAWRTNNYDTYGSGTCYLNYTDTSLHQLSQAITTSQHITLNSYTILFDTTVDVQHNSDGTLTLQTSQNIDHNQFDSSGWGTFNVNLPTIPREAYVTSSSNLIIGNNLAYTLNNPANYYVKLEYYVYNGSGWTLIKTYNAGTGTSGTITMGTTENNAMYQCMPNSVEQNAFIRAYTYSDSGYSVQIGTYKDTTSSPYGKCSINQAINKPDVSTSIIDGNSTTTTLTGNQNKFIKYYSDAQYSITGTPKNYTTIKSYSIICGTKSGTTASGTLSSIESPIFTVRVTDNRDLYTEVTYDRTTDFINYILPTFNPTVYRKSPLTGEAELTFNGNYFDGNFGAELNELTIIATYREVGGTWSGGQNLTATYDGNTYNQGLTPVSLEDLFGLTTPYFDYQKVYEFHFEVYDKLKTLSVPIQTLYKGEPVLWWNENSVNINGSLYIPSTADVSLTSTNNPLQIGLSSGPNIVFDKDEIMARNNGVKSDIHLNVDGGNVTISANSSGNGGLFANGVIKSTWASGGEGGQFELAKPVTTSMTNDAVIDINGNNIRFYHNGGSYLGAYLPLMSGLNVDNNKILTYDDLHAITLYGPSSMVYSAGWTNTKVPMAGWSTIAGSKLTYDATNKGVKIGAGVSKVKVRGTFAFYNNTTSGNDIYFAFYKNSSDLGQCCYYQAATTSNYITLPLREIIVDVAQNDIIYLYSGKASAGTVTLFPGPTSLVVEVLK